MSQSVTIRALAGGDETALRNLYAESFPDEDLTALVAALCSDHENSQNFCAIENGSIIGHIALSDCRIEESNARLSLLGPLAVMPTHQRQGIGGALIRDAITRLRAVGYAKLLVLGDPNYYGRHGFQQETEINPPYAIPAEWKPAWQSLSINDDLLAPSGTLIVSENWQDPSLWS